MKLIQKDLVDETWQEISQYPFDRMAQESERFIKVQPHAALIILAFTEGCDEEVRSLALYLAYVVFRMFEKSARGKIPPLSGEAVENAFSANENWLKSIKDMDERLLERRMKYSRDLRQPFVIQYVIEALYEESEEEDYQDFLDDDSRATILIVIKTLIDALDDATEG